MKKIMFLLFLATGVIGCSVDSLDTNEEMLTADAKMKMQDAEDPMGFYAGKSGTLKGTLSTWNDCDNLYIEIMPTGDDPEEAELGLFSALPAINNGGNLEDDLEYSLNNATGLKWTIPLSTLNTEEELIIFAKAWGDWAGTMEHGKQEYFTYEFDLNDCGCDESFSYLDNEDGTFTFIYIPEEDMEGAEVVFTFAQGVVVSGYEWDWNGKSSSRTEVMELEACEVYTWTVGLDADCGGVGQPNANLWTDFKVGEDSKKGDLHNIVKSCQ